MKTRLIFAFTLMLGTVLPASVCAAAISFPNEQAAKKVLLGKHTLLATSESASIPPENWQRSQTENINLGISNKTHWLKTTFEVQHALPSRVWFYHLGTANLDEVEFKHFINGMLVHSEISGATHNFADRQITYREFTFRVEMQPGVHEIHVRLNNEANTAVQPVLEEPFSWLLKVSTDQLIHGAFFGILVILAFYNVCIFVVVREPVFLLFGLTLFCALIWRSVDSGLASQYLYADPSWHQTMARIGGAGLISMMLFFTREFLGTRRWSNWLDKLLLATACTSLLFAIFPLFQYASAFALFVFSISPLICVVASIFAVKRGVGGGLFLLSSMVCYLGGFMVSLSTARGFFPINLFTQYAGEVSLIALGTISSIALASRLSEEKVRKELAENEAHAKGEFLANMSHEIRTPLNAIVGFADLLGAMALKDDQRQYVNKIENASKSLVGVINDILDYSKIEAGKLIIENNPLSIAGIFDNMNSMFSQKAADAGLSLTFNIGPGVPIHLRGDALRLAQILTNLIANAIKFTHHGTVVVKADLANHKETNAVIRFSVTDTGIGMSKEAQDRLFSPFTQADASTTRKYGGTGLGLAICKQLVELMDGSLNVTSRLDVGSTFAFELPMEISSTASITEPQSKLVSDLTGSHILLVEDNATNQLLAKSMLKKCGATCEIAGDGYEALEQLRRERFDAILMDCQMPRMDGYEATARIREELQLNTPIIAMTANALQGDRERCLAAGMDDYITKPVRLSDVSMIVKKWVNQNLPEKRLNQA